VVACGHGWLRKDTMTIAPQFYIGLVAFGLVASQGCGGEGGPDGDIFNDGAMQRVELNKAPATPVDANPAAKTLPAPGAKPVAKPGPKPVPVKDGYVLTHEHPTYGMAFGGNYAFAGAPGNYRNGVMEKGYTADCGGCKMLSGCDHGEVKGSFTAATGSLGGDMGDHPSHKGPVHNSNSHLRYSTEWVKEAFKPSEPEYQDSRMRIMVAFAVENEAMCEQLYYANKGKGGPGGDGYPCARGDSLESLERQLDALKAWVAANSTWMEIAYTAKDARRIVNADKLAIILGVESEYSFGAEDRTFDPVARLKRYYDKGVRTFYLAHKINSRLAGADIYYPADTTPGKVIRATQAISGCFYVDDNVVPFPLVNGKHNFCDNKCGDNHFKGNKLGGLSDACVSKFSEMSEVNTADYFLTRGGDTFNGFDIYPTPPGFKGPGGIRKDSREIQRNNLGLSHDGERVVREAMIKGMIVNIDHVSSTTRGEIHDLAVKDFGGYPLNALHNSPNELLVGSKGALPTPFPHEYDFDDTELDFVRETGGFFGLRLGPFDAANYPQSGVTENCSKTSTESAKFLAYLLDKGLNVGYSLDYATVTEGVYSRTHRNCGRSLGADPIHQYGAQIAEGLSHIGMMKAWHKELETVGLLPKHVDKLKNDGAEAFVTMWERAEAKSTVGRQIPRETFASDLGGGTTCTEDSACANNEYCGDPVVGKRTCKALKAQGALCTAASQCATSRCFAGSCAAADECQADSGCASGQYCGDPIAGKRTCKALKAHGVGLHERLAVRHQSLLLGLLRRRRTSARANRTARAANTAAIPSRASAAARRSRPTASAARAPRSAPPIAAPGASAPTPTSASPILTAPAASTAATPSRASGAARPSRPRARPARAARSASPTGCFAFICAGADECQSNGDCPVGDYCGDPIAGKRKCKDLLADGKACTKSIQCRSGKCSFFKCKD
jgi:microsomal dipeptidase-like Zn-dependent dipeptidase